MTRTGTGMLFVAAGVIVVLSGRVQAEVTFFVSPDGGLTTGTDPSRDLAFQAALTLPFTEFDFAAFGWEYIFEPSTLMAGVVRVRPNLLDAAGNNAANLAVNGNRLIELYPHVPDIEGIIEGGAGAGGSTILNRTFAGGGADVVGAAVEFTFSEPVEGFGTWIMDDILEPNQYVLKITEVGGATYTSAAMDSGNDVSLAIEGFIAAVSTVGITRAVIEQQTLAGTPSNVDFFYLDHVQVGGRFPPEICDNGVDDNDDGAADCEDSECAGNAACPEMCDDGLDNNGNGLVDCADPECQNRPDFPQCGESSCADGLDNDGDGAADCSDPDCFGKPGCTSETLCSDGLDNDGDGNVDCADADCSEDAACPEVCDDGVDNDADGKTDCNDPECSDFPTCTEVCDDGMDNDADGLIDCADSECDGNPLCAGAIKLYVFPDGRLTGADPDKDLPFQAALTQPLTEFDFSQFAHEYIMNPSPLFAGAVNVRPALLDVAGQPAADLAANGDRLIETWQLIGPDVPGIMEGGTGLDGDAVGAALLNRTYAGNFTDVVGAAIEFTFSHPVEGFGAWIMDDVLEPSRFVLKITEVGGETTTSVPLESGNGTALAIEGFIGAVSQVGITRAVIEQQTLGGAPSNADFFYVDHVQVGGRFSGCADPAADLDKDGDVDQDDFGLLQACFTGEGGTAATECACADLDGEGSVDMADVNAFINCASGPAIPAVKGCSG